MGKRIMNLGLRKKDNMGGGLDGVYQEVLLYFVLAITGFLFPLSVAQSPQCSPGLYEDDDEKDHMDSNMYFPGATYSCRLVRGLPGGFRKGKNHAFL